MKTPTRWFIIVLLLVLVVAWNYATGVQLSERGCHELALLSTEVVWAKEVGADKEKVRVSLIAMADEDKSGVVMLVLRQLEKLWLTSLTWAEVGRAMLEECYGRRGLYPETI